MGYRHWTDKDLPRKRIVKRVRMASFTGYICNGYETLALILKMLLRRAL